MPPGFNTGRGVSLPAGGLARGFQVDRLVLTARVEHENARFVAWVDGLDVQAEGESADVAREELVQAMLIWISARDCTDSMAMALSEAGYPEVDEETELHLEFLDSIT